MQEDNRTKMKILGTLQQDNLILVSGTMISGNVYEEKYLICLETDGKWEVEGQAFPRGEAYESGFRLIELKHMEGSKILEEGFTLVSE